MTDETPDEIDISGIDRAELLRALYNGTRALGMGVLHDLPEGMPLWRAKEIVAASEKLDPDRLYFDYVFGRPIKVVIQGDRLRRPYLYDRDAGEDACARIVARLRGAR